MYASGGVSVSKTATNNYGESVSRIVITERSLICRHPVPSSSLASFSEDAIDRLCQKMGHDRLKFLANTLEAQMKARWQIAVKRGSSRMDADNTFERRSQYIASATLPRLLSGCILGLADGYAAYFEQVHPIYPILDQAIFKHRILHFGMETPAATDTTWSALYFVVLTLGCMYHDGGSFRPAQGLAWDYFSFAYGGLAEVLTSKASLLNAQVSKTKARRTMPRYGNNKAR